MNASRIYDITYEILSDFEAYKTLQKIEELIGELNSYSTPFDEEEQKSIDNATEALFQSILSFESDNFGPVKSKMAVELGLDDLTCSQFLDQIKSILNPQNVAELNVVKALTQIHEETEGRLKTLTTLHESFDSLGIDMHELDDMAEIAFSLPDSLTDNNSESLRLNLKKSELILNSLQEILEDKHDPVKVSQLGDGCLEYVLLCTPYVAKCVADCITKLLDLYERTLKIRKLKAELDELNVPSESSDGILKHEKSYVKNGLSEIKINITNNYFGDDAARGNELSNSIDRSLEILSSFIDSGVLIDVETPPPSKSAENEEDSDVEKSPDFLDANEKLRDTLIVSTNARKKFRQIEKSSADILCLPDSDESEAQTEDDGTHD